MTMIFNNKNGLVCYALEGIYKTLIENITVSCINKRMFFILLVNYKITSDSIKFA